MYVRVSPRARHSSRLDQLAAWGRPIELCPIDCGAYLLPPTKCTEFSPLGSTCKRQIPVDAQTGTDGSTLVQVFEGTKLGRNAAAQRANGVR